MIVYASHTDFEQTNILPFTPPEGLLGATDFLKRRVALPFRGNFAEFRHTMRHEMVHVFQLDMLVENYNLAAPGAALQFPALVDRGPGGALVRGPGRARRDGHARPHAERPAADVQAVDVHHERPRLPHRRPDPSLAREHLRRLACGAHGYKELNRHDSFEAAIQAVYGRTLDQLSDEFQLAMRRQFYPSVDTLAPLPLLGTEVVRLGVKAAVMPDTGGVDAPGRIAYVSPANGYVSIYQKSLAPKSKGRSVVTGGRSAADRVVPSLRLAHGRLAPRVAPVHRPLRRP